MQGRLAQLVEHLLDVQRVSGSIPLASTIKTVIVGCKIGDYRFMLAMLGREALAVTIPLASTMFFGRVTMWFYRMVLHSNGSRPVNQADQTVKKALFFFNKG